MTIKLVIIDDHDILREGIKARLQDNEKFEIIAEGCNGHEGLELFKKFRPDVVLTDISMPQMNGLEATEEILKIDPDAKVIFLSVYDDPEYITKAVRLGAKGFVLKDVSKPEMVQAICRVAQGGKYFGPKVSSQLDSQKETDDYGLTKREKEILGRIAMGSSNKEIAKELNLSVRTVESHRSSIRDKTGGGNAVALAKIAATLQLSD